MAKTITDRKERKKLKVTWVSDIIHFGDKGKKVKFNADDGLTYETSMWSLLDHIRIGSELDADTELRITTADDGQQYPHWIVTQLYADGQPIAGQKKSYSKSSETAQAEIDSKQRNTALMQACDLCRADKIKLDEILGYAGQFYSWLRMPEKIADNKKKETSPAKQDTDNTQDSPIGLDWLKKQLDLLKGNESWSNANVVSYLNSITDKRAKSVTEAVQNLSTDQAAAFVEEIKAAVENT